MKRVELAATVGCEYQPALAEGALGNGRRGSGRGLAAAAAAASECDNSQAVPPQEPCALGDCGEAAVEGLSRAATRTERRMSGWLAQWVSEHGVPTHSRNGWAREGDGAYASETSSSERRRTERTRRTRSANEHAPADSIAAASQSRSHATWY